MTFQFINFKNKTFSNQIGNLIRVYGQWSRLLWSVKFLKRGNYLHEFLKFNCT